jgi:hypothetical protein
MARGSNFGPHRCRNGRPDGVITATGIVLLTLSTRIKDVACVVDEVIMDRRGFGRRFGLLLVNGGILLVWH